MASRKASGNPEAEQIAAALATFHAEAGDLLNQVEDLLESLASAPGDRETLNALFRCAHTIKGSAGLFGLDAIVAFTHHVETLLDELRAGRVAFDGPLANLLLKSFDHARVLLDASRGQGTAPDDSGLVAELVARSAVGAGRLPAGRPGAGAGNAPPETSTGHGGPWHLSVRFGEAVYRSGSDPLVILRYLRDGGGVAWVELLEHAVGPLESQDPEACALGAEVLIEGAYHLEVSSPGIDRPLTRAKDFANWAGHETKIAMAKGWDGQRTLRGNLEGIDGDQVAITDRKAGLVTRDAREVERKKVGLRKARRAKQFSKR